ncbi:unnamed protein product [Linum tenue]|uniref:AP2/ERF domain-containing protein n=1 Tax=Linum tenue TaxID=586396 RepID=A0AAV0KJA3_9ROSI|nr:unnamed protein product [Linum tenue]
MAKISKKNTCTAVTAGKGAGGTIIKKEKKEKAAAAGKRTRKSVPRDSPPKRSSIYRGVTRHRWTGRYEAHLWDKNCWNESQNKKGRQGSGSHLAPGEMEFNGIQIHIILYTVYLGAYDDEEAAAHAYDLAALKYWGQDTILNFPLATYENEFRDMEGLSKEEYISSLRRKSSGFSRGVSKYRGVARHHHNGRWEARIGRVFGNKYLYLGTYATQEEAATAYDMAAIEYRGLNAVTNFDLSRYIKSLRPNSQTPSAGASQRNPNGDDAVTVHSPLQSVITDDHHNNQLPATPDSSPGTITPPASSSSSALGLLLQSSKFKEMLERSSTNSTADDCQYSTPPRDRSFPEDIQTYFDCQDSGGIEGDELLFGDLNSFASPIFHCELDG